MNDTEHNTEVKLGATAPAAETIRDLLQIDVESLKRDLDRLTRDLGQANQALASLGKHIEQVEEITLELLEDIIHGNAETTIVTVEH